MRNIQSETIRQFNPLAYLLPLCCILLAFARPEHLDQAQNMPTA